MYFKRFLSFGPNYKLLQNVSTSLRPSYGLDKNTQQSIENEEIKPRHHPGIIKSPTVQLPTTLESVLKNVIRDTPLKQLINESASLSNFLHSRQLPTEKSQLRKKRSSISQEIEDKYKSLQAEETVLSEEEQSRYNKRVRHEVNKILKQRLYNWAPIEYSRHQGLVYMVARAAPEYAVLRKVFKEISREEKSFSPKTLFDFGSGVGTTIWAAKDVWDNSVKEFFCVDSSAFMNEISREIIDKYDSNMSKQIFYRQFLPSSLDRKYDVVVSSYSFIELPSKKSRLEILLNLWRKTEKYLVLIEFGTMSGFKIISESRDFLLNLSKSDPEAESSHIVAPCPHAMECPRIKADHTPCNFQASFISFPNKEVVKKELFSYLIIKKGEKSPNSLNWPRIVRPVLNRSRHSICRICTSKGQLEEIIFSPAKHGKITYRCAKASQWGDLLPITVEDPKPEQFLTSVATPDE